MAREITVQNNLSINDKVQKLRASIKSSQRLDFTNDKILHQTFTIYNYPTLMYSNSPWDNEDWGLSDIGFVMFRHLSGDPVYLYNGTHGNPITLGHYCFSLATGNRSVVGPLYWQGIYEDETFAANPGGLVQNYKKIYAKCNASSAVIEVLFLEP